AAAGASDAAAAAVSPSTAMSSPAWRSSTVDSSPGGDMVDERYGTMASAAARDLVSAVLGFAKSNTFGGPNVSNFVGRQKWSVRPPATQSPKSTGSRRRSRRSGCGGPEVGAARRTGPRLEAAGGQKDKRSKGTRPGRRGATATAGGDAAGASPVDEGRMSSSPAAALVFPGEMTAAADAARARPPSSGLRSTRGGETATTGGTTAAFCRAMTISRG
ncbi:hypothetical protein THAOC_18845, partial [Thalassiosira oceanica]